MHRHRFLRPVASTTRPNVGHAFIVSLLVALVVAWLPIGAGSTARQPTGPLDLAAMALAPEDVPEGFFDEYWEQRVPADAC